MRRTRRQTQDASGSKDRCPLHRCCRLAPSLGAPRAQHSDCAPRPRAAWRRSYAPSAASGRAARPRVLGASGDATPGPAVAASPCRAARPARMSWHSAMAAVCRRRQPAPSPSAYCRRGAGGSSRGAPHLAPRSPYPCSVDVRKGATKAGTGPSARVGWLIQRRLKSAARAGRPAGACTHHRLRPASRSCSS